MEAFMDVTGISVFGFAFAKVILWVVVMLMGVYVLQRVRQSLKTETGTSGDQLHTVDAVWSRKFLISFWVLLFFAAIFISQMEMAYRPKTVISPENPTLDRQMRQLDATDVPDIGPAEADRRDDANAGYRERNRRENDAAREAFKELPAQ